MSNLRQCEICGGGYLVEVGHVCSMRPVSALKSNGDTRLTIIQHDQINDLIEVAFELGGCSLPLTNERICDIKEFISYVPSDQLVKFMMCEFVIDCCGVDIGMMPASPEQKAELIERLTGCVAA